MQKRVVLGWLSSRMPTACPRNMDLGTSPPFKEKDIHCIARTVTRVQDREPPGLHVESARRKSYSFPASQIHISGLKISTCSGKTTPNKEHPFGKHRRCPCAWHQHILFNMSPEPPDCPLMRHLLCNGSLHAPNAAESFTISARIPANHLPPMN